MTLEKVCQFLAFLDCIEHRECTRQTTVLVAPARILTHGKGSLPALGRIRKKWRD